MKYMIFVSACLFAGHTMVAAQKGIQHRYAFQHPQMGTVFKLVFYSEKDSAAAASVSQTIFDRIDALNAVFSDWIPESELNRLCQTAGNGKKISVSTELFDILVQSTYFSKQSAGAFDVTIGPLTRLWRRSRSLKELPMPDRVASAREKVGWQHLQIYKRSRCVRLKKAGMALDLGGIAQGWTADYCLKMLRSLGITRALVDAGGDIAIGDAPPAQVGWMVELPASTVAGNVLWLNNCGITTSGATARFLELDGQRYSHIIDPRTGKALTHRILVTVRAPNATMADAWATAISVSGQPGKRRALKSCDKLEVWLTEIPL